MDRPLASIIITNYNYGKFLQEAIDSALNQTYLNTEVIVVDDGSTDNSRDIIQSYGERIIPILKQNGGQASAFNTGFALSRGDIICFLDSDDIFMTEKVAEIVEIFTTHSDIGWCYHILQIVDHKNKTLAESKNLWLPCGSHKLLTHGIDDWSSECDLRAQIEKGTVNNLLCCPPTSGLCFRRSLLQQILPMPESDNVSISDNYIKFTAVGLSKGFTSSSKLAAQRIHDDNAFSFNQNQQKLLARINILTAYWMRKQYPSIKKFANNIFAIGLGTYWRFGGVETGSQTVVKSYQSSLFLLEKLELNLRAFYYSIKK